VPVKVSVHFYRSSRICIVSQAAANASPSEFVIRHLRAAERTVNAARKRRSLRAASKLEKGRRQVEANVRNSNGNKIINNQSELQNIQLQNNKQRKKSHPDYLDLFLC
jgi:hypothetical protein